MAALIETVWVKSQDGGSDVAFGPGDKVPSWAAKQMGDHCFVDGERPEACDAKGDDSKSGYSGLKVDELKDAIASRNEGRDEADLLSDEGKKAALIAVLEADDAKGDDK